VRKIELEAHDFLEAKQKQFSQGLREAVNNLDNYIFDNLYECEQRENARERLIEAMMWARLAANDHGIKK
jgi:hypothetical protein